MIGKELSKAYAGALFDIGVDNNTLPGIEEELKFLTKLIFEDKDIMLFLNAPIISKDHKKEFIDKVFADKFSIDIISFLKVLIDNDRQSLLPDIYGFFIGLTDELNKMQRIKVITSIKLDSNILKRIEEIVGNKLKKNILIEQEINDSILGGIVIEIADKVIDGSIAKDLNVIRTKLIQRKVGSGIAYED